MKEVVITIICLTYNHEKYIRKALEGFLMQKTNFVFEILIHDDASADRTPDIIREYETKYSSLIKPVYQRDNQYSKGVEIFSTYLFPKAKGKYIALCEGDDYWTDPLKLQKQVDFLEKNPDYSMCFHDAIVHWQNGEHPDSLFSSPQNREYTGKEIYRKWTIPTASVIVRDYVVKDEKYKKRAINPHFIYGDIILFLSAAELGKIYGMSDVMCVYRRHEAGLVYGNNINRTKLECIHDKYIGKLFNDKEIKRTAHHLRTLKYNSICLYYLKEKKYLMVLSSFMRSFFLDPVYNLKRIFKRFYKLFNHVKAF